jgi:Tfp pilus assembly protein PilX
MRTHFVRVRAAQRGFAIGLALIAIAVLFFAAMVVMQYASMSASNAGGVQYKQSAFDAAEAGVNDGIRALDVALGATATGATGTGTLGTGATYTWTMEENNLISPNPITAPDGVSVPGHSAYISATASLSGDRTATVGAIIAHASGLQTPGGAIDAAANIFDDSHAPVLQAADNSPADVHANGIITVGGNPGTVQGSTYAAGSTNAWTTANNHYANQPPVAFPSSDQVTAIANTANGLAKSGTTIQGSSPTGTYTGNVYVNGAINLSTGTVQFNGGGTVYINGNVTLSGKASIVNENGSLIVVNGTFASSGQSVLTVPSGSGGQLMVLATDPNPSTCAAGGGGCAVTISGLGSSVGMLYVPNGSVQMAGNGTIIGALMAGVDVVFNGGGSKGAFQYDDGAASGPINAANYKVLSYLEK